MKPITINLLGAEDRSPGFALPLDTQLLDPGLLAIVAGGLVAVLALPPAATWVVDTFMVNPAQNTSDSLAHQISQNKGAGHQVEQLQAEVLSREHDLEQLQGLVGQGGRWAGTLQELRTITPTNLWLTSLRTTHDTIDLTGEALAYKDVAYFYTNLQNSRHFTAPKLGSISMSSQGSQQVIQFSLDASLLATGYAQ